MLYFVGTSIIHFICTVLQKRIKLWECVLLLLYMSIYKVHFSQSNLQHCKKILIWMRVRWMAAAIFSYTLACFTTALIIVLFGCQTLTAGWGNLALELSVQFKACFFNLEWFFSNLQKPISYRNLCVHFLSCWLCFYISII